MQTCCVDVDVSHLIFPPTGSYPLKQTPIILLNTRYTELVNSKQML